MSFLSGLAGADGGLLILPALMLFAGLRFNTALGPALPIAMNWLVGFLAVYTAIPLTGLSFLPSRYSPPSASSSATTSPAAFPPTL